MYEKMATPKTITIIAHKSSNSLVGKISPYPTVVQVTVAQYNEMIYFANRPPSYKSFEVTQFTFVSIFPKEAKYHKQPVMCRIKTS